MRRESRSDLAAEIVVAFGLLLFALAVLTHGQEVLALDDVLVPGAAFLLDSMPALGLAYGGYRLAGTDLRPDDRERVALWCLLGSVLFVAVIGATFLIRWFEGRVIAEPAFPLLIAAEAGGLAGLVAGYFHGRARTDARRADEARQGLEFVNFVIRHDLRNDLSLIRSHAELLAPATEEEDGDGAGDPDTIIRKTAEATERIETSQAIAETLVGEATLESVDLASLASEAVARLEQGSSVSVTTDIPSAARVRANEGLRSVLDNLLENALEHNDRADPTIECEVEVDPETVTLTVADDGPGMPGAARAALVGDAEPGSADGGVHLVGTLVDAYEGEITVEENDPRGTRIVVAFQRAGVETG